MTEAELRSIGEDAREGVFCAPQDTLALIAELRRLQKELDQEQRLHGCTALSLRSANKDHGRERELRLKDQALRLELVKENRWLREALLRYGDHQVGPDHRNCPKMGGDNTPACTCGLDAALAGGERQDET